MELTPEMLEYLQRTGYFSPPEQPQRHYAASNEELSDDEMAAFLPDDIDSYRYQRAEELRREYRVSNGKLSE